ncbi:NCA2-domain-containing protein [Amylocystis lapponica]|nr:NCA2-domain-containing protein [Amylocystis lapponica]
MASFVSNLTRDLSESVVLPPPGTPASPPASQTREKQSLQALFLSLDHSTSLENVSECLATLQALRRDVATLTEVTDSEETGLQHAILGKVTVELYGQALNTFLQEARDAEDELEWWNEIERSRSNLALYLLQTLPLRLLNLSNTILSTLRKRNLPIRLSAFSPSSLRQLFPSRNLLLPNILTIALFPHLRTQPYLPPFLSLRPPPSSAFSTSSADRVESAWYAFATALAGLARNAAMVFVLPLELTRSECKYKQQELQKIRDERAEFLGTLAEMRGSLASALEEGHRDPTRLNDFAVQLQSFVQGESLTPYVARTSDFALASLHTLASSALPSHVSLHSADLTARNLLRPSRLTLLWPRLVLLPPLALYLVRTAYASRASLQDMAIDALETARGFWEGWLLEPLRGVVKTVRAGGEDGVIVTQESVRADLGSLERMTLALAQEKLHYDAPQMEALAHQIELGDLTAVMQIYEEDIKRPFRSAVGGTLLRSLFIQVQKAKVDINQALAGIDKLLRSQELTFAFVGVAPALAIVYTLSGYLGALWTGGRGGSKYGGRTKRASIWLKMRRIERLLIAQPKLHHTHAGTHDVPKESPSPEEARPSIPPLTAGLLLLSVSHLRAYAEKYLPASSRLREGFLEDVVDLEDPALGRAEKLRVLDRMWRSWGEALGWGRAAGDAV